MDTWIFLRAVLVPMVGLIGGLIHAFDPNPQERRLAGYDFSGMVVGLLLWWAVYAVGWPAAQHWVAEEGRRQRAAPEVIR